MEIQYYPSKEDFMWNDEVTKILPYTDGQGIDVGCGGRSIRADIKRVDIDPDKEPDILCSGDEIPVSDESFNFVVAQHILEHFEDQDKALKEWLRILKPGGYLLIIHPDISVQSSRRNKLNKIHQGKINGIDPELLGSQPGCEKRDQDNARGVR